MAEEIKITKVEGVSSVVAKKIKRPWRNKVRKLARKKAEKEKREQELLEKPVVEKLESDKKKKKKPKKKKVHNEGKQEPVKKTKNKPVDKIEEAKKRLEAGQFRFLNEKLYTISGSEAFEYFKNEPEAFNCYHKGFADQVKKWPNHPLNEIIRWLRSKPEGRVVLDLGCGEAKIAASVGNRHNIRSFDLVAVNDRVEECDMSKLPVEEGTADIVIFCLSLMGTNLYDFIKEARRVLKLGGILKIAEVRSRFLNVKLFYTAVQKMGFEMAHKKELTDYFIMFEFTKIKKVEEKRPFGLKLKPCLYKKR